MKQINIPVDGAGIARVTDFVLVAVIDLSTLSYPTQQYPLEIRLYEPRALDPTRFGFNGRPTASQTDMRLEW